MPPNTATAPAAPFVHLSRDFIQAKEYLEAILASTSDAICTTNIQGKIIYFSPGAEKMLAASNAEVIGRPAHQFYPGGREEAAQLMKLLTERGILENYEMILKAKDGRRVHVSMSASLLKNRFGAVIGTLGISKDITSRVELENRLRELSITDNLTGLHNQRHFHETLEKEVSRARRQRDKLSMILIDLDDFKKVNDRMGHLEGDRILKGFASAISQSIRKEVDSAYRYGGDEFVILLPGLTLEKAKRVTQRIAAAGKLKLAPSGIGFSYGLSALSLSRPISEFVHQADRRMFAMKASRKKTSPDSKSHAVSTMLRAVASR